MSAPALVGGEGPTLRIRGRPYPVLLPTLRDPRLHLAAVIVSLQVLGQTAFGFSLSIAQILVSLATCAVLEFAIAFRRQRVIMWPASALLTGNGVAFVLRVPGTEHGDWWSLRGWWIFAGTAAVSLLSKHLVRFRGRHLFNPSNFGLVVCFLALGKNRADPLDFWWAPMSTWMALALVIIVAGGLLILLRLQLLDIAVGFWVTFAAGIGVLALSGHAMTARWHLGEITGGYFWRILVLSPEVLVFLFFMITDPKTIPEGRTARRIYAVGVGLLAVLLIAPQRTEFASKVALLGALAIVCAASPLLQLLRSSGRITAPRRPTRRGALGAAGLAGAAGVAGLIVLAGIPARSTSSAHAAIGPALATGRLPSVTIEHSKSVASQLDRRTAVAIARSLVADLAVEANALRLRDARRLAVSTGGNRLDALRRQIRAATGKPIAVPTYSIDRVRVRLEPGVGQGPPVIVAPAEGTTQLTSYEDMPSTVASRTLPRRFRQTFRLTLDGTRYLIVGAGGTAPGSPAPRPQPGTVAKPSYELIAGFAGVHLRDVAKQVGLDFRQGDFRFSMSSDVQAMMGGGLCWLDYDNDGWMDLFVVNSYSDADIPQWEAHGGLPRSALFHNVHGRFVDVSRGSGADLPIRGNGCVAADFNGDGYTDLYVTTAEDDQLLWNNGNGTFTEGARASGVVSFGWHSGAAVADVNGDGRPDLFVAGYTDINAPTPGSAAGFPTNHLGVRDELFLNEGNGPNGHARFREVGRQVGLDPRDEHGLGAIFTDVNGDGRPDLYVANDADPNRLYLNVPWPGGAAADPKRLGFRLVDVSRRNGVADIGAGMGVAVGDFNGDGVADLFVSNSRGQEHAVFTGRRRPGSGPLFAGARQEFTAAFGRHYAGWGDSWVDLNRDGHPDLVLANGDIPITNLEKDAGPIQVLGNVESKGQAAQIGNVTALLGLDRGPIVDGRGLAAADYDNNGTVDIAVNSIGGPLILLRNSIAAGHWLEVSLAGFHPGAVVTAVLPNGRTLVREEQAGSSYLSSEDPRLFFGLGDASTVRRLVVRYPDGTEKRLTNVPADQILRVS